MIDPLLPKQKFAEARGISVRSLERKVKDGLIPRGEPIDDMRLGWRGSLVNMSLAELAELAKAQAAEDATTKQRSERMRKMGAKGGRRSRASA